MSEKFVVFGGYNCRWCDKARALLTLADKEYEWFYVTHEDVRDISEAFGFKTVPQIFVVKDDKVTHIGGFLALQDYLSAD